MEGLCDFEVGIGKSWRLSITAGLPGKARGGLETREESSHGYPHTQGLLGGGGALQFLQLGAGAGGWDEKRVDSSWED